nr:fimbrial biogenesis outer membrane usher protein [Providencia rettgeri]
MIVNSKTYCIRIISIIVSSILATSNLLAMQYAYADEYFNPALLDLSSPEQAPADLSAFESVGGQNEGAYLVDIYLNEKKVDSRNVDFKFKKDADGREILQPCISVSEFASWGVLVNKYPDLSKDGDKCADIQSIPQANSNFRFNKLQLSLNFPQSSMKNAVREWVDPKFWNDGISAFLLNYSINGANNYTRNGEDSNGNSQYINLRPGINLGPWRFRNYTTYTRNHNSNTGNTGKWDTIYTYAQRGINQISGLLTLGDSSTPSDVFDSISFRGVQLASDDDMLPDSMKGYAPIVRGIARSNAQVTIRQNGYVIYQTYVSPGSFEINDMYPTGGAGDLHVTIKESDGSEQFLVIPFASLPILQREGRLKYSATSGEYRTYDSNIDKPFIAQLTAIYGLPWGATIYGGLQASKNYKAFSLGQGQNMGGLGAFSVDLTQAWATLKGEKSDIGQSWRIRYSKNIAETGTNFAIAGYRYSTSGYWSMQEALDTYNSSNYNFTNERRRSRTEVTLNQNLWENAGNIVLSAISESYWDSDRRMDSIGVGYNNSYNDISYSINYTYNRNSQKRYSGDGDHKSRYYDKDQIVSLNVSIPLSKFMESNTFVNYSMNTSKKGNTSNSVSLGGTTLEDRNLSWNIQDSQGSQGQGNSFSTNADWRATYGEVSGGYSRDKYSDRLNYTLQGSVIAHEDGITLGQPMGETVALIVAPDVSGATIMNQTGVKTDAWGYAITPYLSPYKNNTLSINPQTLANNTDLELTTQTVTPTRGAIVKANYKANVGYRVLMTITMKNGFQIPFGSIVSLDNSPNATEFITGDSGQVFLSGLPLEGRLHAKWGNLPDEQCNINYILPDESDNITNMKGNCI